MEICMESCNSPLKSEQKNSKQEEKEEYFSLISLNSLSSNLSFSKDVVTFGRGYETDHQFKDPRISKVHCKVKRNVKTNEFIVQDCSTNGTYINDQRIGRNKSLLINSGDSISFYAPPKKRKTINRENTLVFIFQNRLKKTLKNQFSVDEIEESEFCQYYTIGKTLGKGSFGTVYEGTNLSTDRKVALKIIDKNKAMGLGQNMQLVSEIEILTKLDHPHTIGIEKVFETTNYLIIALELITGGDLGQLLSRCGQLDEDLAKSLFYQIITAVDYLHEEGIVHRDLKPENILLTNKSRQPQIKITDFGLSKIITMNHNLKTMCGTPAYLAPEILNSGIFGYSKNVDLWSCGVILYQMLSGELPFNNSNTNNNNQNNNNFNNLFQKIQESYLDFNEDLWENISPSAQDLVENLLIKNPQKRFTTQQALNHQWFVDFEEDPKSFQTEMLRKQQTILIPNQCNTPIKKKIINNTLFNNSTPYNNNIYEDETLEMFQSSESFAEINF
ncbi:ovarian-specific serine/threonine-protein kinase lok-related [Anaeramoeba flamelloides]|uniref:Ovarian-specific serine/threonine-protein kinase lok-related n=1 Tax=Anaeramoeba flamelloides TaxID=1746091 RepID=A0ABQ8YIW1_9EUKA|nr:ovarian-specific serine/threonine-protein kinase lok-related [Anaeramoeba flamelloides]